MSIVNALLNKIVSHTETNTATAVTAALTPVPTVLIGNAQIFVSNKIVDTSAATVKFDYLIVQYYNTTKITFLSGTTSDISIPGISSSFPEVGVTATVTGTIASDKISFSISSTLDYSSITPTPYNVMVE